MAAQRDLVKTIDTLDNGETEVASEQPLQERRFLDIDLDNFDAVLNRISPSLSLIIENTLIDDGSTMNVNLTFESMRDFEPVHVAEKVPVLRDLLALREKLVALKAKLEDRASCNIDSID